MTIASPSFVRAPLGSPPNGSWPEKVVPGLSNWITVSTEEDVSGKVTNADWPDWQGNGPWIYRREILPPTHSR